MKTALVVGGTGPSGPHLVEGLAQRGYDITLFHRGTHEVPGLEDVEHIHGQPHFRETIADALRGRHFDVVFATYGRTRHVADEMAGRCNAFIGVGSTAVYPGMMNPDRFVPCGTRIPLTEADEVVDVGDTDLSSVEKFISKVVSTEQAVLENGERGAFSATWFRYPRIYGPRNPVPYEWSVIRRVLDGRSFMILSDGGLQIRTRCAARNAAAYLLAALDRPQEAAGQVFNCGDRLQFTTRQWVEEVTAAVGGTIEIVSMPDELALPAWFLTPDQKTAPHVFLDTEKAHRLLAYEDLVDAHSAIVETVQWLLEHPVTPEAYPTFPDPFDYELETGLASAFSEVRRSMQDRFDLSPRAMPHPYAHPKTVGLVDHRGR